jgi:hypothetical protein
MEPKHLPGSPVVWLVTEDVHLIRADTITGIGITSDQLTVWQGDRATTVIQVADRTRFSTSYAGLLAAQLAASSSEPPLDHEGRPYPLVYVWLYLDDQEEPCWQVAAKGGDEVSDPPEPPFSANVPG